MHSLAIGGRLKWRLPNSLPTIPLALSFAFPDRSGTSLPISRRIGVLGLTRHAASRDAGGGQPDDLQKPHQTAGASSSRAGLSFSFRRVTTVGGTGLYPSEEARFFSSNVQYLTVPSRCDAPLDTMLAGGKGPKWRRKSTCSTENSTAR